MMRIQAIGGPTAILEVAGLRLLTDPAFDPPGSYPRPDGPTLVKLTPPAATPEELGDVDVVLLSHDQHADNLDLSGRAYLVRVPLTLTTRSGAARLTGERAAVRPAGAGDPAGPYPRPRAQGLAPWDQVDLVRPDGGTLRVTAVPARHGPEGCEPVSGEVTGFVLTGPDVPTTYLSGDNAWLGAVHQVAVRFGTVDVAVLFAGAARFPDRFGGALLTLDGDGAVEAARALRAGAVIPVHYTGWQHFTEGGAELRAAFQRAGLADQLVLLAPGESAELGNDGGIVPWLENQLAARETTNGSGGGTTVRSGESLLVSASQPRSASG